MIVNLMRVIGAILGWMLLAWQPGKDLSDGKFILEIQGISLYSYSNNSSNNKNNNLLFNFTLKKTSEEKNRSKVMS